ncbi:MAG TPA: hypothetical protein DCE42_29210 [Myxococcales bacterium]|nr:hypothetical protein [Deltaproteobacteria bacterium]MBU53477.1 hypothetical protein [Deltaproteobacteria bacterium]HAA58878.1 hypothetical protein [Myxococcales bacterium]|tara:strand:- start:5161 stop:5625 length:465 start_codon:yes stop_codon:yes gene_type:complete
MEIISLWFSTSSTKEKVFTLLVVGLLLILSVFGPVMTCQVGALQTTLKETKQHLAQALQNNELLRREKVVGKLQSRQHQIALKIYKTLQHAEVLQQDKTKLISQIQQNIQQFSALKKKIQSIRRDGEKEAKRLKALDIDEQMKEIQRRSKRWQQ